MWTFQQVAGLERVVLDHLALDHLALDHLRAAGAAHAGGAAFGQIKAGAANGGELCLAGLGQRESASRSIQDDLDGQAVGCGLGGAGHGRRTLAV